MFIGPNQKMPETENEYIIIYVNVTKEETKLVEEIKKYVNEIIKKK